MTAPLAPKPSLLERVQPFPVGIGIDLGALMGALLIVKGVDLIHRPSAYIVAGVFAIGLSVLSARRSG